MAAQSRMIRTFHWTVTTMVRRNELGDKEAVNVLDIGVGGICFQTQKRYEAGDILYLDLNIKAPFLPGEDIDVSGIQATVKWGITNTIPYTFGLQFAALDDSVRSRLFSLIQQTETRFGDLSSPLFR